jgi:hypothetical protein
VLLHYELQQIAVRLPVGLQLREIFGIARKRRSTVVAQDVAWGHAAQCPIVRDIKKILWGDGVAETIQGVDEALDGRVHIKEERREVILGLAMISTFELPCMHLVKMKENTVDARKHSLKAAAETTQPITSATQVIVLDGEKGEIVQIVKGLQVKR